MASKTCLYAKGTALLNSLVDNKLFFVRAADSK